jgi:hypothetical protein
MTALLLFLGANSHHAGLRFGSTYVGMVEGVRGLGLGRGNPNTSDVVVHSTQYQAAPISESVAPSNTVRGGQPGGNRGQRKDCPAARARLVEVVLRSRHVHQPQQPADGSVQDPAKDPQRFPGGDEYACQSSDWARSCDAHPASGYGLRRWFRPGGQTNHCWNNVRFALTHWNNFSIPSLRPIFGSQPNSAFALRVSA